MFDTTGDDVTAGIAPPVFDVADHASVSNRIDVVSTDTTNDFSSFSVEGDDNIFVTTEADSGIVDISTTSIAPPSHDPYEITIALMDSITRDGRRFDVPHGSAGEATFTVEANDAVVIDGITRQQFSILSISNVGPFSIASLDTPGSNVVDVVLTGAESVQTYQVHFRVNYRVIEYDTEGMETSNTIHHQDENYTVVVDADFYAGLVVGTDALTTLAAFGTDGDRGVIANGKSITVTNSSGATRTLWLGIPTSIWTAHSSTFNITTNGYNIHTITRGTLSGLQLLEVGTLNDGENLTLVIGGI